DLVILGPVAALLMREVVVALRAGIDKRAIREAGLHVCIHNTAMATTGPDVVGAPLGRVVGGFGFVFTVIMNAADPPLVRTCLPNAQEQDQHNQNMEFA
ncbi:MAG: hypothetical protein JSV55_13835, partial [Deltaproteobacteria bacterium]